MKHHASKPKRKKAYQPKLPRIPVMPELQMEFMFAGHGALAALRLAPNAEAFDQLAAMFNVIYLALQGTGRRSVILESGMRALQDVADRQQRSGVLALGRFELPPIETATLECEKLVRELDVMSLHLAGIKTRALAQLSAAAAPLEPA